MIACALGNDKLGDNELVSGHDGISLRGARASPCEGKFECVTQAAAADPCISAKLTRVVSRSFNSRPEIERGSDASDVMFMVGNTIASTCECKSLASAKEKGTLWADVDLPGGSR